MNKIKSKLFIVIIASLITVPLSWLLLFAFLGGGGELDRLFVDALFSILFTILFIVLFVFFISIQLKKLSVPLNNDAQLAIKAQKRLKTTLLVYEAGVIANGLCFVLIYLFNYRPEESLEVVLSLLLLFPAIIVFALPFILFSIRLLEEYSRDVPISRKVKFIGLRTKVTLVNILTVMGTIVLFFSTAITGLLHQLNEGEGGLTNLMVMAVLSCVSLLVNTISILIFANFMSRPIKKTIGTIMAIAESYDLTKNVSTVLRDEIGELGSVFNVFTRSLDETLKIIKNDMFLVVSAINRQTEAGGQSEEALNGIGEVVGRTKVKAEELDRNIQQLSMLSDNVNSFISDVSDRIVSQSSSVSQASASIEEMSASINNIAFTIEAKLAIVDKLQKVASLGEDEMGDTISVIQKIADSANVIGEMLGVIKNIADQTNLLAMNAAIEAAHAGEYGRGFAVVADEIRKLSEDTAMNSREIENSLKNVLENIKLSEASALKTGDYFKGITGGIDEVATGMFEIKSAVSEITVGSGQIVEGLSLLNRSSEELKEASTDMKSKVVGFGGAFSEIGEISEQSSSGMERISLSLDTLYEKIQDILVNGKDTMRRIDEVMYVIDKFKTVDEDEVHELEAY